jgi:formiminotetrahydrofolate cyclodeaminase
MNNKQTPILNFLDNLGGPSAAPGGGAAAALSGAMGAALVEMVCNLTIGRPSFAQFEADLKKILAQSKALRTELSSLFEADQHAFQQVMAAYRLARQTEFERQTRRAAIQAALQQANQVQLAVVIACVNLVGLVRQIIDQINPNTLGDLSAAVTLAEAGLKVAHLNIAINLGLMNDPQNETMIQQKLTEIFSSLKQDKALILNHVLARSGASTAIVETLDLG